MSRIRALIFFFLIAGYQAANAQMFDTISRSFEGQRSLYFNYGSQYSFISNQFASVSNIKLGVDFGGTFKIGLAYNWLTKKFPERTVDDNGIAFPSRLHVNYFSVFGEYTFFRTYHWEATIPAQIGAGWAYYSYKNAAGVDLKSQSRPLLFYEPLMTIQYRFLRYFGVGCGIGFRLALINSTVIREQMNSPLIVLKSKLFIGDLWRDINKKRADY